MLAMLSMLLPCLLLLLLPLLYLLLPRRTPKDGGVDVVIVGAGISGITMAKKLLARGLSRFLILEEGERVGGTWAWNSYPGCAVNTPTLLYSFSWLYKPDWTRRFPLAKEIQEYLAKAVTSHGIDSHVRFGVKVTAATWQEEDNRWRLETVSGQVLFATVLINAAGMLHAPHVPQFEGRQQFEGETVHTARWREGLELEGRRVAVIGSGSSGVQVVPEVMDKVGSMTVFQRTPALVFPKGDHAVLGWETRGGWRVRLKDWLSRQYSHYWTQYWWHRMTARDRWLSISKPTIKTIRKITQDKINDPELKKKVIPTTDFAVKAPVFTDDFFECFNRENFRLVTERITRLNKTGIELSTGEKIDLDVIIYATGFDALKSVKSFQVTGRQAKTLESIWGGKPKAYMGMCVPHLPNYFITFGPNSHAVNVIFMVDCSTDYICAAVEKLGQGKGRQSMCVRQQAYDEYNRAVREEDAKKTYSTSDGGFYRDEDGFNWVLYPWPMQCYRWATRSCREEHFSWT